MFVSFSIFRVWEAQDPIEVKEPGDLGLDFETADGFCMVRSLASDVEHPVADWV